MADSISYPCKELIKSVHHGKVLIITDIKLNKCTRTKRCAPRLRAGCTDSHAEISVLEPFRERNVLEPKRRAPQLRAGCSDSRAEISVLEPFREENVGSVSGVISPGEFPDIDVQTRQI